MVFKILMSITFLILLVVKMFCSTIEVDTTTIILAILIFLPWIIQYIKSLEINGIGKLELVDNQTKEELVANAKNVGTDKVSSDDYQRYSFYRLKDDDTKLAMAALRIEIENQLRIIADNYQVNTNKIGLYKLAKELYLRERLDRNEMMIIQDLSNVLNKAVHSQLNEYSSYEWIFDIGLKLVRSLEEKANNKEM